MANIRDENRNSDNKKSSFDQYIAIIGTLVGVIGTFIGWHENASATRNARIAQDRQEVIDLQNQKLNIANSTTAKASTVAQYIPLLTSSNNATAVAAAYALKQVVDDDDLFVLLIQSTKNDALSGILPYYSQIDPLVTTALTKLSANNNGSPVGPSSSKNLVVEKTNATLSEIVANNPTKEGWNYVGSYANGRWDPNTIKVKLDTSGGNRETITTLNPEQLRGKTVAVIDDVYLRQAAPLSGYDKLPDSSVLGILQNDFQIQIQDVSIIIDHKGAPAVWVTGKIIPASPKLPAALKST